MEQNFKVIRTFQNIHIAYILKDRLEMEGIESFITDENTITNNPFFSNQLGGANLQVRIEDEEKAIEILNNI